MDSSPAVNASSMIDLKAILFSKANEVKNAKATGLPPARAEIRSKKKAIWAKRTPGNTEKRSGAPVDSIQSPEEEGIMSKSRAMLHQKAALYEKLMSGENQLPVNLRDNEEKGFLVDFEKKSYDKEKKMTSGTTQTVIQTPQEAQITDADDWVDYVDSLGRTRRCLRSDIDHLQQMDRDLSGQACQSPVECNEPEAKKKTDGALPWLKDDATLMSGDMYRELRRQKWEEQEAKLANLEGDTHYEDIRFDEVREMGVGYYQFSTDKKDRQEQMEELQLLRNQTMEQRKRRELLKDRRQAAVKSRLAKVRARRGNPPGQEKQENLEEGEIDAIETVERPKNQQVKVYEASDVMVDLVKSRKLEEERRVMTQLEWERGRLQFTSPHSTRSPDRNEEFAPPSENTPYRAQTKNNMANAGVSSMDLTAKAKISNPFHRS